MYSATTFASMLSLHAHIRPWDRFCYDCCVSSGIGCQKGCSLHSASHVKRDEHAQVRKESKGRSTSQHTPEQRPARHYPVRAIRLHACECPGKRCACSCEYLLLISWTTLQSKELLLIQSAHGSCMPANKCRVCLLAPVARLIVGLRFRDCKELDALILVLEGAQRYAVTNKVPAATRELLLTGRATRC